MKKSKQLLYACCGDIDYKGPAGMFHRNAWAVIS